MAGGGRTIAEAAMVYEGQMLVKEGIAGCVQDVSVCRLCCQAVSPQKGGLKELICPPLSPHRSPEDPLDRVDRARHRSAPSDLTHNLPPVPSLALEPSPSCPRPHRFAAPFMQIPRKI